MTQKRSAGRTGWLAAALVLAILVVDQTIKIAVKTNMCIGDSIHITDWFLIEFIENNGMAYGITFFNKLALSIFRIVLVSLIGCYIRLLVSHRHRRGYIVCLSMILAGAAGNIFDSMFYGLVFDASTPFHVSQLVPFGEGYAPFLHGKVVDMFYFPLIVSTWPDWMPVWGGQEFIFFSPVFNFADSCISVGAAWLIIFYRRDLRTLNVAFARKKRKTAESTKTKKPVK